MFTYVHLCVHNICIKSMLVFNLFMQKSFLLCIFSMYTWITTHYITWYNTRQSISLHFYQLHSLWLLSLSTSSSDSWLFFFLRYLLEWYQFCLKDNIFLLIRCTFYYFKIFHGILWACHVTYYTYIRHNDIMLLRFNIIHKIPHPEYESILNEILLHLAYDLRIYFIIYNSMKITPTVSLLGDFIVPLYKIILKMFSFDGVKSLIT